jgi:hypothetical protein
VVILYSNRTRQPPLFPTAGPRQPETTAPTVPPPPIFTLEGSRPPAFQLPTTDIPSSSTRPMFQPAFDMTTEDQLGWDQMEFVDVLVTLDAPRQAKEVGPSQLTQTPVWTQPTQPQGGVTPAGGATPTGGWTLDATGSSQAAMATPSPNQLGPRVVRTPDPWMYDRDHTWLAVELLGPRGGNAFRCSTTFTMILYKLFASTR